MKRIKEFINTKTIILITILAVLMILIINNKSGAFEYANLDNMMNWGKVGDTLNIGYTSGNTQLVGNNKLYCVQHGSAMNSSIYTLIFKVRIEGNRAISSDTDASGNAKTNENAANGTLAYILGGGNYATGYGAKGNSTARQKELWHYWNKWVSESGTQLGINWTWSGNDSVGANTELENAAINYATNGNGSAGAQISSNVGQSIDTDNERAGAFNITYTGKISSAIVNDVNGNDITNEISFEQNGQTVNPANIVAGQDFYIINKTGKILKDVTINVTSSGNEVINADIWLFKNTSTSKSYQKLLGVKTDKTTSNSQTASTTIGISTNNTLRVVKYGVTNNDEENERQTGVRFVVYKNGSGYLCTKVPNATGKMTYNNTDFYWTEQRNDATIFKTGTTDDGWQGYFQITGLPSGTYYVGEVYNPNKGYEKSEICNCNLETWSGINKISTITLSNIQHNQNLSGYEEAMQVVSTTLENGYTKILRIYDSNASTNLTINKESTSGKALKAGFILYSKEEKAFVCEDDNSGYTDDSSEATVYKTNSEGTKVISNLDYGTYYIFEVEAPSGYSLSKQDGYKEIPSAIEDDIEFEKGETWVYCSKVTLNSTKSTKSVTITNKTGGGGGGSRKDYRTIKGYVWIDEAQSKNNANNNVYDENEKLASGIKVNLVNKSNKSVTKTTTTDSEGKYTFSSITSDVSNYYVEFDYSNSEYAEYGVVTPSYKTSNGSKVTTSDDKSSAATTYTGTNSTTENQYGLSAYYNSSTLTVDNINMGLIKAPEPGYEVAQNIAYIEISMNGYTYKYTYGGQGKVVNTVPTVNWKNNKAYTRDIYPSDIIYNIENQTEALKINVVYRIDITNTTNTYMEYVYMEKNLQITNLVNTYDHDRYTLADNNWTEKEGNANINSEYLSQVNGSGLTPNQTATAYITFKVNQKAIEDVLTNPTGVIENQENPTKATATAYHNYERKETKINKQTGEPYDVIRSYKTTPTPKSATAYYLLFKLPENPRKISGTVFEDLDVKNEEVIGNGKYDNSTEGTVSNVKVELLLNDKTSVSKLYQKEENGTTVYEETGELPSATFITGEDGKYYFEGVVPGEYYIRYTYGDGTQKIKKVDGTTEQVYSNEYKSTIVTSNTTKTGLETNYDATKALWYIDLEDSTYSIAVDNLEKRKEISNVDIDFATVNDKYKDPTTAPVMIAETARISIPVEYTKTAEGIGTTNYPSEFNGMNFGIIKMPEIVLNIDKEITNTKLTLSNGQVLFDGNPLSNMSYVSSLDGESNQAGGSGYVRVELDNNYIYGSTIVIRYGVKVTNNSDLTYLEEESHEKFGWYYKYGDSQYAKEATVTITDVIDYLDPKLTKIASDDEDLTEIKVSDLTETDSFNKALLYLKYKEGIDTNFEKLYDFKSYGTLTTTKGSEVDKASKTLHIDSSKLLSSNEEDLEFISYAQIVKGNIDKLTYKDPSPISNAATLEEQVQALSMTQDSATITILPPTGKQEDINYTLLILELAILSTGIIIIKKKVLK